MKLKFWGVRGSIPIPGQSTVYYGGNTACLEVRLSSGRLIIIDSGSGIRELGNYLVSNDIKRGPLKTDIFLSHTHWDHIHGFPFFTPIFIPGNEIAVHGPVNFNENLEEIVAGQMRYSYFPVKLDEVSAKITFSELQENTFYMPGGIKITTKYLNHPILCLGYRIEADGKILVTLHDTEPYRNLFEGGGEDEAEIEAAKEGARVADEMNQKIIEHAKGADLVVFDAQYTRKEYITKVGWGHSTVEDALTTGIRAKAKRVVLFHHEPTRSDEQLARIEKWAQETIQKNPQIDMEVYAAREGLEIEL